MPQEPLARVFTLSILGGAIAGAAGGFEGRGGSATLAAWLAPLAGAAIGGCTAVLCAPATVWALIAKPMLKAAGAVWAPTIFTASLLARAGHPVLTWCICVGVYLALCRLVYVRMDERVTEGPMNCGRCGYDLTGLAGARCPECDAPVGGVEPVGGAPLT